MPPSSPVPHNQGEEWDTPVRKRVRTLRYDNAQSFGSIEYVTGVPKQTVQDICAATSSRRNTNNPKYEEQRGYKADLDVCGATIRRHMGTIDYHKRLCRKGWANKATKKKRLEYTEYWKQRYPEPKGWYLIRFSDACHYGFWPQGTLRIIRKPGEQYCQDCIQEGDPKGDGTKSMDQKRQYIWAAAGYEFKSDLIYYNVPGNYNGKMTHQVYIDAILEPVVKPWIIQARRGLIDPWILEEDGDSGHGGAKPII
ncbi:hypothetical protein OEA41_000896 [Lepraria neglecta]|uniref:Uncharacterized protein n=1 Tax=Lepraria neglecta TaxID=209136 RepID=A0AAD9ZH56_9LECA|nr:hypothetical protein OEA41_000896 [Lepraria neglecta]